MISKEVVVKNIEGLHARPATLFIQKANTFKSSVWIENGELCGELRSEKPFEYRYKLVEENHHFAKEGEDYFRISQVYRLVIDKKTGETVRKELVLDNHSRVMYDHSLIPKEQISND